ncbi:PLP-dependent transferase [Dichomitus squalens]|uniref:PLP-dependent transferase n=2 Tax=Dichomitus squalens TaxID=114155 RepID=A0A4Q9Q9E8_9APHY|nr:PLP-dependent transferase [Dichomitus squalens LYAD-421 SS1]EJF62296.1 PLP-dependent transferase [Dichomitus squalens LYAD-421 SS1]TBU46006.1 PLP-dependent transferase [Dichomitus squalens]TBU63254.1 PLP-dependent transferase [Dichomitus squalens]
MEYTEKQPKAIDLAHHLSDVSRARETSPLKDLARQFGRPGLISLAGGMPNEAYFPFASISGDILHPASFSTSNDDNEESISWFWKLFGGSRKEKTSPITIPKHPAKPDDINLTVALQYGTATGLPQLQKFISEFVEKVYQPAYADWTALVQTGNTDGWSRCLSLLCNPGEAFITEDWTYPSALAGSVPSGKLPVGVPMDDQGMRHDELRKVLEEWDEAARGAKRPHVMYTVPIGQNPTGVTMGLERKKAIYDICVEFDIIIVEDDPYYFLQMGKYAAQSARAPHAGFADPAGWLTSLAPSYVKIDYQGRVIRLDTFSKTIAPGSRLGFFTCNPVFAERLERIGETSTQAPCGFGQSLITQLLTTWQFDGYARWLQGLAAQYTSRRNSFIDALQSEFHLRVSVGTAGSWKDCVIYTASAKARRGDAMSEKAALFGQGKPLFSFVPPSAGMFLWLKFHWDNVPGFKEGDEDTLEMKLWKKLAKAGVLVVPGRFFASDEDEVSPVEGHFRISFSYASNEAFKKSAKILSEVVGDFFHHQS